MFARTVTALTQPGRLDEAIRIYRDSVAPAVRQQKGCRGIFFLADRNTGKFISPALWDTEADITAGEASSYLREQIAKGASTLAGPPITEHFEVSIQA